MTSRAIVCLAILSFIIVPSAVRTLGIFSGEIWRVQQYLGGDKVVHLMFGAALMGCFSFVSWVDSSRRTLLLFALACLILVLEEVFQSITPGRHFDWIDMFWGLLGAFFVFIVSLLIKYFKKS